ncbi:hypothetical protein GMDG_04179 [Pseudogymnoascus destructans 20631-21]|uniref:Uncharacterized protein n=1 Tax=Pseudogymnoascus destructans (strain ATCC MYA-4855 / 20631-21) TaxID=658429 RepID=L8GAM6_PSED2|nr:hypothetical protein GMDG_04179 [Pseudogymnoascus destructans 20631-21]
MALIKFLITALAATLMFTSSVLANPIPALTAVTTPDTTANHLEKQAALGSSPVTLDSPGEGVAHAPALRHGNGIDACVQIWFAGT